MKARKRKKNEDVKETKKGEVEEALLRRALGCELSESQEEYVLKDGELVLVKKKVSTKSYPPEVSAIKILMKCDEKGKGLDNLTVEELELEKERLLRELKEEGEF